MYLMADNFWGMGNSSLFLFNMLFDDFIVTE